MSKIQQEYRTYLNRKNRENRLLSGANWKELGPRTIPDNKLSYPSFGIGRINCVRLNPDNENTIWIGSASGGIWKSIYGGSAWAGNSLPGFLAIGINDIAISPSNPNIIYAATGDPNGVTMSGCYSIGIIKSTNGGATWDLSGSLSSLDDQYLIGKLLVHPDNPDIVIAATNRGILKTTDGGFSWKTKKTGYFYLDMEFNPFNASTIYASTFNFTGQTTIQLSNDMGETWKIVKTLDNINRIAIAVTPADTNYVYAVCSKATSQSFGGFYVSTNAGNSYELRCSTPNILGINSDGSSTDGQGYYDLAIAASPFDTSAVFIGGIHMWKTGDCGSTWTLVNHWTGADGKPFVHADQQDLVISKSGTIYSTNDGGIYKSTDWGTSWTDLSNGLGITQFYRIGCSQTDPGFIIGGTQDNGSHILKNGVWDHIGGGDGMECLIDYSNPDIYYFSLYYGSITRVKDSSNWQREIINQNKTGEQGGWITPYELNPINPQIIYAGFKNVWKSEDQGNNWTKISNFSTSGTLDVLEVAPSDTSVIYAANSTNIWTTKNSGASWDVLALPPVAISYIAIDPKDANHFWATHSGYLDGYKVTEFKNGGWKNISGTLPIVPINSIVCQKGNPEILYIATDIGVFYFDAYSNDWQPYNDGLPTVIVSELEINYLSNKLRAGTFGRGIWEADLMQCELIAPTVKAKGSVDFCIGDSVTIEADSTAYPYFRWSNGETKKSITVNKSGSYYVVVGNGSCYAKSEDIDINVIIPPTINMNLIGNNPLCDGDSLIIYLPPFGYQSYQWSTNETGRKIKITAPGIYYAIGTTADGCIGYSDTVQVSVIPKPAKPQVYRSSNTLSTDEAASYKWFYNDKQMDSSDTRSIDITKVGSYYVVITDTNGCSNRSDLYQVISSVDETEAGNHGLEIYPNPVDDRLTLKVPECGKGRMNIEILNILGERVFVSNQSCENDVFTVSLDTSNLPAGMYHVTVDNGVRSYGGSFVKLKN
jgi:photosystem II stability/assembly factor-like uncharacterized protein